MLFIGKNQQEKTELHDFHGKIPSFPPETVAFLRGIPSFPSGSRALYYKE